MKSPTELLKDLKRLNLEAAQLRIFFVRRYIKDRKLSVSLHEPDITPKLALRVASAVKTRLNKANTIDVYAPLTTDADEGLLMADPARVNWDVIQEKLNASGRNGIKEANEIQDLKDADFFVVEFDFKSGPPLYAAKQLPQKLSINRLTFDQWLFKGGKLNTIEEGKVFNVTLGVDFLSWDGRILIAEKKVFESIMNIREGMTRKRDELFAALGGAGKFEGLEHLQKIIGDNAHMLRRASQVADSKNWSDPTFVTALFDVVGEYPEWGITVEDGKIVITPENSDGVLSLLNDARAESFILKQVFDAPIKKPVGGP